MARTIAGAERTLLAGRNVAHFLRVRVANHLGTLTDLRTVSGADYQLSATVVSNVDTPADTATVVVRAGRGTGSIAPLMVTGTVSASGRLIDVGRSIVLDVAVLAVGSSPSAGDWRTVFDGTIDTVAQGDGQRLTLSCRNRMLPILDATTASTTTILPEPAQDMLASLLTLGLGAGAPTIVTPTSPGWTPAAIAVDRGSSVWQKMAQVADQIGWMIRYRWNGNTPELRFFAPNRSLSSADWTLASAEVAAVREASLDLAAVRNEIQVGYRTSPNGALLIAQAQDGPSIAAYDLRRLIIDEEASSQVDTLAEAQVMADAILSDVRVPPYSHTLTHRHALWCVEVGDIIDVPGNAVTHDLTQRLAVVGTELSVGGGGGSMTLRLRGAPASRTSSWLTLGGGGSRATVDTTTASASFTSSGAVRINVIGPVEASAVRAAVSISAPPSAADVDAATGGLAATANMAALTSPDTYAVGTTVYVAAAAYIGTARQRVVQLVVVRDASAGTVAVGPDLEVRLSMDATTATVTWVGDGTIEMSEDGGAYAAPPASPFTRTRGAQGSDTVRSLTFRAILSGQTISNTVTIPPRATVDTVAPDLRLVRESAGADVGTFVSYTVQVSNPQVGGPTPSTVGTWRGTSVDRWNGSTWVGLTSGATLANNDLLRMSRPANGSEPGSFTVRATISGAGGSAEEITVQIPQQAIVLPPALLARVISSTATSSTVRVENVPAGGVVRWTGGTATLTSGEVLGTDYGSPRDFVFDRPAINAGTVSATFRGTVSGVSDDDAVTIEEQGRDTIAILTRARVIAVGATTYTVRVSGSAPFGPRTGSLAVTQIQGVTVTNAGSGVSEGVIGALNIPVTDGDYSGGNGTDYLDLVVARPAIGATPGRVSFRMSATGCTADTDSVDVEPQRAATPGRLEVASTTQSTANYFVRFRAWEADGTQVTATGRITATIFITPASGGAATSTTTTVTWDGVNTWFSVGLTRNAAENYSLSLSLSASGATAQTVLTVPVPNYTPPATGDLTPRIQSVSVVNTGTSSTAGDLRIVFGGVNLPAGGSYRLSVDGSTFVGANVFTSAASPVTVLSAEAYTDGVAPPTGKSVDRVRGLLEMLDAGGATVDSAAIPYNQFWGII